MIGSRRDSDRPGIERRRGGRVGVGTAIEHAEVETLTGGVFRHRRSQSALVLSLILWLTPLSAESQDSGLGHCRPVSAVPPLDQPFLEEVVGKLTGHIPFMDPSRQTSTRLAGRATKSERRVSADLLVGLLGDASIEAQARTYRRGNFLWLLDLLFSPYIGANVYALIEATTESDEYVVLGAHYDAVSGSPGADDNATGVALVVSVARAIARAEHRGRNLVVVLFDQEEEDLVGSRAFAESLVREGLHVHSVHTADMVGWDADGDRAVELELPTTELEAIYEEEARCLSIPVYSAEITSSDHQAFRNLGFPAVGISEEWANDDSTPHHHEPEDTYETIDFRFLASTTRLVTAVITRLVVQDSPDGNASTGTRDPDT